MSIKDMQLRLQMCNGLFFSYVDNDRDGSTDEDCSRTVCQQTTMVVADRIDNDCDGEIDEELCDGLG